MIDLSVGHATCVRQAFLNGREDIVFPLSDRTLSYGPHEGNPQLIEITRQVIKRQVGYTYKHILLTNGATGGISLALRMYSQKGYNHIITKKPPYFSLYPEMIIRAGLNHICSGNPSNYFGPVLLIDAPSNPLGDMLDINSHYPTPRIHDAVYYNKVYTSGILQPIPCNVLVGSYSKLLGLNGLRTGWIATDDDGLYNRLKVLVTVEYAGLSTASEYVLLTLLRNRYEIFWEAFETRARNNLNDNRTEWSRLEKYFNGWKVSPNGMFHYSLLDSSCKKLLERSEITWTPGSQLGTDDNFGRFNLGASCQDIRKAVKEVLKQDKI